MKQSKFSNLQLDGGCVVFDFINTVNTRTAAATVDYIECYEDIIVWAEKAALLSKKRIRTLSQFAEKNEVNKEAVFRKAIKTREVLYALFSAIVKGKNPDAGILNEFNKILAVSFSKMKLNISSLKSEISFTGNIVSLDEPICIIMKSAYDILTSENRAILKECPGCGWLFIDKTKNGKRRWCDMKVCGSNDKAKRYYYRKKAAAGL
jgi:predicted RNA-binding Zn ribbon-like protein